MLSYALSWGSISIVILVILNTTPIDTCGSRDRLTCTIVSISNDRLVFSDPYAIHAYCPAPFVRECAQTAIANVRTDNNPS
jgi:hypothetical protein